jgi:RNA polymerase sigma-70 factor (ECF subfamily)
LSTNNIQDEFLLLVQTHQGLLHKICHLYENHTTDREDLFQEMILQLWKSYGSFRGEARISTWIYRIALNTALSSIRKSKRRVPVSYPENIPHEVSEEKKDNIREEQLRFLYKAVAGLTEIERALVMLYLDEKSYDEMEEIMGISSGTLRVKMNRIKEKLKKQTKDFEYGT